MARSPTRSAISGLTARSARRSANVQVCTAFAGGPRHASTARCRPSFRQVVLVEAGQRHPAECRSRCPTRRCPCRRAAVSWWSAKVARSSSRSGRGIGCARSVQSVPVSLTAAAVADDRERQADLLHDLDRRPIAAARAQKDEESRLDRPAHGLADRRPQLGPAVEQRPVDVDGDQLVSGHGVSLDAGGVMRDWRGNESASSPVFFFVTLQPSEEPRSEEVRQNDGGQNDGKGEGRTWVETKTL